MGLSPRVRGNPGCGVKSPLTARSIPACAGEPHRAHRTGERMEVYPRVCGGTSRGRGILELPTGLSPRVRGNRFSDEKTTTKKRSIPACAGEPSERSAGRELSPGLSPRVRGNQLS